MAASDVEIARMIELLARDLSCTKAAKCRDALPDTVQEVRDWYEYMADADIAVLTERVVEDTQEGLMDTFVDTSWPACPRHPNHPLWFHDDAWYCERDQEALSALGGLCEILPALAPEPPAGSGPFVRRPKKG